MEKPTAMSPDRAWAMIWRENTSVEADVVGQRGEHGPVVDEGDRRQGAAGRRVHEQLDRPLGIGGTAAVAEGEESPSPAKTFRHLRAGPPHLVAAPLEGGDPQLPARGNLARADVARSATRAVESRSSDSMNG